MSDEERLYMGFVFACLALGIMVLPERWMEWADRELMPWVSWVIGPALVLAMALNFLYGFWP